MFAPPIFSLSLQPGGLLLPGVDKIKKKKKKKGHAQIEDEVKDVAKDEKPSDGVRKASCLFLLPLGPLLSSCTSFDCLAEQAPFAANICKFSAGHIPRISPACSLPPNLPVSSSLDSLNCNGHGILALSFLSSSSPLLKIGFTGGHCLHLSAVHGWKTAEACTLQEGPHLSLLPEFHIFKEPLCYSSCLSLLL